MPEDPPAAYSGIHDLVSHKAGERRQRAPGQICEHAPPLSLLTPTLMTTPKSIF
jgi:hypothetical protein